MIQYPVKRRSAEDRINRFGKLEVLNIGVQERDAITESRSQMDSSFREHVRRLVHSDDAPAREALE